MLSQPKILLYLNPISGGTDKSAFKDWAKAECETLGYDLTILETTGNEDDRRLIETYHALRPYKVLVGGGDGTVVSAAGVLLNEPVRMGIVPFGSANGMAKELGFPKDPNEAFTRCLNVHKTNPLDLQVFDNQYYGIHISDFGLNAQLIRAFEAQDERGMHTYAKLMVTELQNLKEVTYTVETESDTYTVTGVMLAIANARKYGTGAALNSKGSPFDGLMEIEIIKEVNTKLLLTSGMSILNDQYADSEFTEVVSCKRARITCSEATPFQIDGEYMGERTEVDVKVLPGAVNLIQP